MLPPALLDAADRLITTLMTLVDAIFPIAKTGSTPTLSDHAAKTLFVHLSTLVTTLIRISNFGLRAAAKPAATPSRTPPDPAATPARTTLSLPRRPGWLLAALPDIAPAIAADLRALLADPALTALLAAAPTLHRTLRPLLRGLDLATPQPPPSPNTPPPIPHTSPPLNPARPTPPTPPDRVEIDPSHHKPFHDHFIALLQRYRRSGPPRLPQPILLPSLGRRFVWLVG